MNADLSVWVAIAALAFTILSTVGAVSFFFGQVFERLRGHHARLRALEDGEESAGGTTSTLRDEVIRLGSEVKHIGQGMRELKDDVRSRFEELGRAVAHAEAVARNTAGLGKSDQFRELGAT